MIDLKALNAALGELEEERHIPREKIMEAISDALVAAYKKDYGKKGQIVRANFNLNTGQAEFFQIKTAVDNTIVRTEEEEPINDEDERSRFNEEHHIWLEDAKKIKKDIALGEELIFPLESKDDYGRIAAQTAKQVIIQRVREAEKVSILNEYEGREGEVISGKVQKIERGNVFVDLGRTTAILPYEEQIPGEFYRQGERVRAYLYLVEDTPRGIALKLSRSHPKFVECLFEMEAPEIASGAVEVKAVAREAGSRTKIAVESHESSIDPVGSMVGQRGTRVNTVIAELGGEKIDIIEWSNDTAIFITNALSPAKIINVTLNEESHQAIVDVAGDQFSLAVGKGGQNVRLAAKLTGWKIDITTPDDLIQKDNPTPAEEKIESAEQEKNSSEVPATATDIENELKAEESKSEVTEETDEKVV